MFTEINSISTTDRSCGTKSRVFFAMCSHIADSPIMCLEKVMGICLKGKALSPYAQFIVEMIDSREAGLVSNS